MVMYKQKRTSDMHECTPTHSTVTSAHTTSAKHLESMVKNFKEKTEIKYIHSRIGRPKKQESGTAGTTMRLSKQEGQKQSNDKK